MGKHISWRLLHLSPSPAPILSFLASRGIVGELGGGGGGAGRGGSNSDVADVADVALRILFYGVPLNELLIMIRVFN